MVELTSKKTKKEDIQGKFALYRDTLRVREYVLFDPKQDYLKPSLAGLPAGRGGVRADGARGGAVCASEVLGLDLEREGQFLRVVGDPASGHRLPNRAEIDAARREAEEVRGEAEQGAREAEEARREAEARW